MHPTVIIRVALPKNNLAKPQHIGGACVKWIPPFELLAAQRKMSINKLYEELSSLLMRGYDAEMRFRKRASGGETATKG